MQALKSSVASLPVATRSVLPTISSTKARTVCRQSETRRETVRAKAVTLNDLTLQRTEQKSYSQPAAEDTCEHPSQILDDRKVLQGYVHGRQCNSSNKACNNPTHWYRCEPSQAPLKVAVLLSGGVDSSCALHLLKQAGHHVTAFYLQIWFQEDFRNYWDQCPWEDDLSYCQQVCILGSTHQHDAQHGDAQA